MNTLNWSDWIIYFISYLLPKIWIFLAVSSARNGLTRWKRTGKILGAKKDILYTQVNKKISLYTQVKKNIIIYTGIINQIGFMNINKSSYFWNSLGHVYMKFSCIPCIIAWMNNECKYTVWSYMYCLVENLGVTHCMDSSHPDLGLNRQKYISNSKGHDFCKIHSTRTEVEINL